MIVVSMALTGLAIVLLVIGLAVSSGLGFIYASIAVSLVAIVALGLGIARQRSGAPAAAGPRDEPADPAAPPAPGEAAATGDTDDEVRPVAAPRAASRPGRTAATTSAPTTTAPTTAATTTAATDRTPAGAETGEAAGTVLVVPGRPRYHVSGCRYLGGRQAEQRDLAEAREAGFSACGVCRPDDVLAAQAAGEPTEPAAAELAAAPRGSRRTASAPARRSATPSRRRAGQAGDGSALETEPVSVTDPAPVSEPVSEPAGAEAESLDDDGAPVSQPTAARRAATVVAVRTRFHRPECRFAGVPGAESVSKATARRRGLTACGVCKP